MVGTRSRVRLVKPKTLFNARPVWKEERPELENLVVSGERLRQRGARGAEAGDEGRREPEATDRCDTPSA